MHVRLLSPSQTSAEMHELAMAAFLVAKHPAVFPERLQDITNLHELRIERTCGICTSKRDHGKWSRPRRCLVDRRSEISLRQGGLGFQGFAPASAGFFG